LTPGKAERSAFDPHLKVAACALLLACSPIFLFAQKETASLTGSLQDTDGKPLSDGVITLESPASGIRQASYLNQQGIYRFSELPAGAYILTIFDVNAAVKVKQDLLAGEQKIFPPLTLKREPVHSCGPGMDPDRSRFLPSPPAVGGLTGSVQTDRGPAVGARLSLDCWDRFQCGETKYAKTDSQGNFAFENIQPGSYLLRLQQDNFFPILPPPFDIAGGLESFYSFKLTPCPNGDCTVRSILITACE
jgi:hypothetical protein